MLIDAAVLSADFEGARKLLNGPVTVSYSDRNRLQLRAEKLASQEQAFKTALAETDKYIYSPGAVSMCDMPPFFPAQEETPVGVAIAIGGAGFTLSTYIKSVRSLAAIAPLNEAVLDRVFHATFISSKYSEVEDIGDKILAAQGRLEIIGYAKNEFVRLVIDADKTTIGLEVDDHPFGLSNGYPASHQLAKSFSVPFTKITQITQEAGYYGAGVPFFTPIKSLLSYDANAIKLKPEGAFPQYALMAFIHCSAGSYAQKSATHNLGAFIQHVIKLDDKSVSLVKPTQDDKDGGAGLGGVVAGLGMALGVNGSAQLMQSIQSDQAAAAEQESQRNDLYSAGRFTFSVSESPSVRELESTLSLAERR
jgi:hypothetical protein